MKIIIALLFIFALSICNLNSQSKTIKGRVITNDLETIPLVSISVKDTVEVGKTDFNGFFQMNIADSEKKISFSSVGCYPTTIELEGECDQIEVVMMLSGGREFTSLRRADKQLKKRFENLPTIHKQAFDMGVFETENACYKREFEPFYVNEN